MSKPAFYNFPRVSKAEWWDKIREDLKGQKEDSLFTNIGNNLKTNPFYNSEDLAADSSSFQNLKQQEDGRSPNDWDLIQTIHLKGKQKDEIISMINHGIQSDAAMLELILDEEGTDLGEINGENKTGLIISSQNIDAIKNTVITLNSGSFSKVLVDQRISDVVLRRSSLIEVIDRLSNLNAQEGVNPFVINTDSLIELGADAVDEGVYALSLLNELIKGIDENINKEIVLRLNTGSNFFLEVAKIRAIRKLAGFVIESYGLNTSLKIEVHTSSWNKSVYDRYTNILRNTSESFAAVAGGADMLNIRAFEVALGIENEFSLRNSRNISHLLRYESHIDKVKDVAAGSYFVENLTKEYAKEVWEGFQKIEKTGGLEKWIEANDPEEALRAKANHEKGLFGQRRKRMIGTNVYPNPQDQLGDENIDLRDNSRLSASFERFRVSLDIIANKNGQNERPSAMLLKLGNSPMRFARSGFSANFLETAGLRMVEQDGMPEDFGSSRIIVICGSDEDYVSGGKGWIKEIKAASKDSLILFAGMPENHEELKSSGVDLFIHIKAPLEETLNNIFKALNIETA